MFPPKYLLECRSYFVIYMQIGFHEENLWKLLFCPVILRVPEHDGQQAECFPVFILLFCPCFIYLAGCLFREQIHQMICLGFF